MGNYMERRRPRSKPASTVGVRELKTHAARIVREVRETRASYVVTHRGKAVGVLMPIDAADAHGADAPAVAATDPWQAFVQAGRSLERRFVAAKSATRMLSDSRR
jgi:prevent-host-death family protein